MDLSGAVSTTSAAVTSTSTGVPKLISDFAPLIGIGVVLGMFFGLLGRVLRV